MKKLLWVCLISLLVQANGHKPKQESTKATDWIRSWETCEGDGAIKTDGTLWQFGKVGGCSWGRSSPSIPKQGNLSTRKNVPIISSPRKQGALWNRPKCEYW